MTDEFSVIKLSSSAYTSVLSHALKHCTAAVMGIFIGNIKGGVAYCHDAFPVSHSFFSAPTLSLGFSLAEEMASALGVSVIGTYFAAADGKRNLTPWQQAIVKQAQKQNVPIVTIVDTQNLKTAKPCLIGTKNELIQLDDNAIEDLNAILISGNISDMDDHMIDINNTWSSS